MGNCEFVTIFWKPHSEGCCSLYSQVTVTYPTPFVSALQLNNMSENRLAVFRARALFCLKMPEDIQVRTSKRWKNLVPALAVDVTQPRSSASFKEEHTETSCRTTQSRTQHRVFSPSAATLQINKEIKSLIKKKKINVFEILEFFNSIKNEYTIFTAFERESVEKIWSNHD